MKIIPFFLILTVSFLTAHASSTSPQYPAEGVNYSRFTIKQPPLLPLPQQIKWGNAVSPFQSVRLDVSAIPAHEREDARFKQFLKEWETFAKAHEVSRGSDFTVKLIRNIPNLPENVQPALRAEAYEMNISANEALITSEGIRGAYYALQTLKQLIVRRHGETTVARCHIIDWPDLKIRGFMNDVGRNYMPLNLIKQEIDAMALLKYNTYHFHFCDDHGWRLESKIYPRLNAPDTMNRMPGKYYTQKEFRELVEYCRVRNIQLIPEMDMPGHCAAFRKALGVKTMNDPKATAALERLIAELASLEPPDRMPYIHIGTDEAREAHEKVDEPTLKRYFAAVEKEGRQPIRWQPGLSPKGYNNAIEHLWMGRGARRAWPTNNGRYIDSHETYVNHIDPFETGMTYYFRRPCPYKNAEGLGFMLCSWPDLPIENPRNQVLQTPVYSAMAFCSQSIWNNPHPPIEGDPMKDDLFVYFSNLPQQGSDLLKGFAECENRVLAIRDRFFVNKEFNYLRQAHVPWKLIGPFPHGGHPERSFAPEQILRGDEVKESYTENGKEYVWKEGEYSGHTIIFKHYCDYPTLFNNGGFGFPDKNSTYYALQYIYSPKDQKVPFWISGQTWATSDWRNGPVSVPGEWFHAKTKFWVNGREIAPPQWAKPGNNGSMVDENYHFRKPTTIALRKGWNQVLIKCPNDNATRRWMFTFAPVKINQKTPGCNVKEFPNLRFSTTPKAVKK